MTVRWSVRVLSGLLLCASAAWPRTSSTWLAQDAPATLTWHYEPMPGETHATIYHPAALLALRRLFKPQ